MSATGTQITLDFDATDAWAAALARACTVNLGMSIGTLLCGELSLHGAAVSIDGKRISIRGPSGAGKSTLLWRLLNEGVRFGNDDVIPVRVADGRVMAAPAGGLFAKLSCETLDALIRAACSG